MSISKMIHISSIGSIVNLKIWPHITAILVCTWGRCPDTCNTFVVYVTRYEGLMLDGKFKFIYYTPGLLFPSNGTTQHSPL